MVGIIGKKLGMSQIYGEDGSVIPISIVEAGPCQVVQVKSVENDGYLAVQLGFCEKKGRRVKKPEMGIFKKYGLKPYRYLREFREFSKDFLEIGKMVTVEVFNEGDRVKVTGISKGKGFQGVVKRHGFRGGPKTHGQSDRHRAPGSIGASTDPARVIKGLRMAGRMGNDKVTVSNLKIIKIDKENNLLYISGAIPGHKNSIVTIRRVAS